MTSSHERFNFLPRGTSRRSGSCNGNCSSNVGYTYRFIERSAANEFCAHHPYMAIARSVSIDGMHMMGRYQSRALPRCGTQPCTRSSSTKNHGRVQSLTERSTNGFCISRNRAGQSQTTSQRQPFLIVAGPYRPVGNNGIQQPVFRPRCHRGWIKYGGEAMESIPFEESEQSSRGGMRKRVAVNMNDVCIGWLDAIEAAFITLGLSASHCYERAFGTRIGHGHADTGITS
ncbi:hypothetical protein G1C97_0937 [Bifidobacterium sp. DSM 109959]|uniref:Uncharacterized protein n=1 Tax=Bifidobacterium olomucense TaxID=2675324 RepID=A0A7Y0EX18_9BIFI|nr:hypothetical protein [Bifidobacterium sp. DSM 109959]